MQQNKVLKRDDDSQRNDESLKKIIERWSQFNERFEQIIKNCEDVQFAEE